MVAVSSIVDPVLGIMNKIDDVYDNILETQFIKDYAAPEPVALNTFGQVTAD